MSLFKSQFYLHETISKTLLFSFFFSIFSHYYIFYLTFILSVYSRAAIWEQNFRPFMDERARRKKVRDENDLMRGAGKGRKKYAKRDAPRESASQAVFDGVNTKKASKKINYDALQGAFGGDGSFKLPTQVIIDPSLNVYSSDNSRNIKPSIDGKPSASTTYPFSPFGSSSSSSSSMRLSLQSHDKKVPLLPQTGPASVGSSSGPGAAGTRKTFLMSESRSSSSLTSDTKTEKVAVDKKEDIPLRTGVISAKEVLVPEDTGAMDDEDMLMYDEGDNNDDDYDDDEEY